MLIWPYQDSSVHVNRIDYVFVGILMGLDKTKFSFIIAIEELCGYICLSFESTHRQKLDCCTCIVEIFWKIFDFASILEVRYSHFHKLRKKLKLKLKWAACYMYKNLENYIFSSLYGQLSPSLDETFLMDPRMYPYLYHLVRF